MKRLAVYLKPFLPRMGVGISFKAVGTLVELAIPWILSYIIDDLIPLKEIRPVCLWGSIKDDIEIFRSKIFIIKCFFVFFNKPCK